ncbi:hypothetical protein WAB17_05690 [Parerythrobacter aurantius]|uniref:hypothetical protein n=1 Tax=Parerythrobacter aurantius TaxID=3127706 RepID=UPI00324AFCDC
MTTALVQRTERQLARPVRDEVRAFAQGLAAESGAVAALFYGSNLRTGELEGVLDFYLLVPGPQRERIWPRVSYHERNDAGQVLRAKVATMSLDRFVRACNGDSRDTTVWARFVQPSALVWHAEGYDRRVVEAVAAAARTAARLAVALGPLAGTADDYWRGLFQATYQAEFRVEKSGRENTILESNRAHFEGLLPLALDAAGIGFTERAGVYVPSLTSAERARIRRWWEARRRLGKPINLLRLAKATTTFEGAAHYAAWKVERHTGVAIEVTPFREKHPLLAAPGALVEVMRARRGPRG